MVRTLLLLLGVLCSFSTWSQTPIGEVPKGTGVSVHNPSANSKKAQEAKETQERAKEAMAKARIEAEQRESAIKERQESRAEEDLEAQKAQAQWALYLLWVGGITALILIWQSVQFGQQLTQNKLAIEVTGQATELARQEFVSTHRPQIRVKHLYPDPNFRIWADSPVVVKLVIVNSGLTEAIITEVNIDAKLVPHGHRLPPRPAFSVAPFQPDKNRANSGITLAFKPTQVIDKLTQPESDAIRSGMAALYCYGFVEYQDILGGIRKTAFCRKLKFPTGPGSLSSNGNFIPADEPDYEYQD